MSEENIRRIDSNNTKALAVVKLAITTLENGIDVDDIVGTLEVVRDYLTRNNILFDKCQG